MSLESCATTCIVGGCVCENETDCVRWLLMAVMPLPVASLVYACCNADAAMGCHLCVVCMCDLLCCSLPTMMQCTLVSRFVIVQ